MFDHLPKADSMRRDQFDAHDNVRVSLGNFGSVSCGSTVKKCTSNEVVWFGRCGEEDASGSGICSPPLWKTTNPHQNLTNYNDLSAAAKAQAVARGQEELMEMIKNMPESSYELSLKDLVEHNHHQRIETQKPCRRLEEVMQNGDNNKTSPLSQFTKEVFDKKKTDGIMKRSGSLNNGGFLLKMVLPFDLRSKRKKRVILSESKLASSKVSPRSSSVRSCDGLSWFGENESIGRSSKSDSKRFGNFLSTSRTNSKNNRLQPSGIFLTGCWSVFSFKKNYCDE